jgi:hypothetical protein
MDSIAIKSPDGDQLKDNDGPWAIRTRLTDALFRHSGEVGNIVRLLDSHEKKLIELGEAYERRLSELTGHIELLTNTLKCIAVNMAGVLTTEIESKIREGVHRAIIEVDPTWVDVAETSMEGAAL